MEQAELPPGPRARRVERIARGGGTPTREYAKSTGNWEETDYTYAESPGYSYSRNIKYADCYIEYNGMTLFPAGMKAYPAVTSINYSNFDNGSFSETLETGNTIEYAVEFNTDGQPNKITAPDGTVTWIEWSES